MSRQMARVLRVRTLMEDISRAEYARQRADQRALEARREEARETALALRGEARAAMERVVPGTLPGAPPGLWQRYLEDSERRQAQAEQWDRAARKAAVRTGEAERKYMEDRRSRMQAEILVREKLAAERLEQERREQREIDDWFGMGRGARMRRTGPEDSPI